MQNKILLAEVLTEHAEKKRQEVQQAIDQEEKNPTGNVDMSLARLYVMKAEQVRASFRELEFWRGVKRLVKNGMKFRVAYQKEIDETGFVPRKIRL